MSWEQIPPESMSGFKWTEEKRNDVDLEELSALTAIVNQETVSMDAFNKQRDQNGHAPAYVEISDNCLRLQEILKFRKVI
jgi:hypothetical protein